MADGEPANTSEKVEVKIDTSELRKDLAAVQESVKQLSGLNEKVDKIAIVLEKMATMPAPVQTAETKGAVVPNTVDETTKNQYDGLLIESGGVKGKAMFMEEKHWPKSLQPSINAVKRAQEVKK